MKAKAEAKLRQAEKRAETERERKRAVKAAKARAKKEKKEKEKAAKAAAQKEKEKLKGEPRKTKEQLKKEKEAALLAEQEALKKTPSPELGPQLDKATFLQLVGSKTVLQSFAHWLETDSRVKNTDAVAYLRLYLDVNAYDTPDPSTDDVDAWKDGHAKLLSEKYFSRQSHKAIPALQPVVKTLVGQRDRPRTPALKRAQELVVPHLESLFKVGLAELERKSTRGGEAGSSY